MRDMNMGLCLITVVKEGIMLLWYITQDVMEVANGTHGQLVIQVIFHKRISRFSRSVKINMYK